MDVVRSSAEWEAAEDPYKMIYLPACRNDRKRRLVVCAVVRELLARFPAPELDPAVDFAEAWADGSFDNSKWKQLRRDLRKLDTQSVFTSPLAFTTPLALPSVMAMLEKEFMNYSNVIAEYSSAVRLAKQIAVIERRDRPAIEDVDLCGIVREIFGNPFAPVVVQSKWKTKAVRQLGTAIYEEHDIEALPVLADALEEAGCDEDRLLDHLRKTERHFRGCWALDLVLGVSGSLAAPSKSRSKTGSSGKSGLRVA